MNIGTVQVVAWMLAGLIATLVMDIGGSIVRGVGWTHGAPPQFIGRFFLSVFRGHLTKLDPSIPAGATFPPGLVVSIHYGIGAGLAVLFGLAVGRWESPPAWWMAVLYGIGTTVLPALWMFPALGFGVLGLRGPEEFRLLPTALVNHLFFGFGLALAGAIVVPWFR